MKFESFFKYLLILSAVFTFQSCNEDTDVITDVDTSWQSKTKLFVTPVKDKETFIWYKDLITLAEYWGNSNMTLDMELKTPLLIKDVAKIDFYLNMEEKDGYNYTAPFDTTGKLVKSVSVIPTTGKFQLIITATEAYNLFLSNLKKDRSVKLAQLGDIFLLHWVITAKDGSTLDSRQIGVRYLAKVRVEDYIPPVWKGTFNYVWIEVGSTNYGKTVGTTGSITITDLGGGKYTVSDGNFGFKYGGPGTLTYTFLTGLTSYAGVDSTKWQISNINGKSIDIKWTSAYTSYGEWGKVTLTRTDAMNWPTNIYTVP